MAAVVFFCFSSAASQLLATCPVNLLNAVKNDSSSFCSSCTSCMQGANSSTFQCTCNNNQNGTDAVTSTIDLSPCLKAQNAGQPVQYTNNQGKIMCGTPIDCYTANGGFLGFGKKTPYFNDNPEGNTSYNATCYQQLAVSVPVVSTTLSTSMLAVNRTALPSTTLSTSMLAVNRTALPSKALSTLAVNTTAITTQKSAALSLQNLK